MAANFQRGSTPIAGQQITSRDFGNLANASTAARQSPSSDVFGVQAGGGFVAFPVANRKTPVSTVLLAALQPGSDVSTNSNPMYTITYGTYGGIVPTIGGTALVPATASNVITFSPTDTYCYMQSDFTYNTSTGMKTVVDSEIKTGSGALPATTVSGGSGTVYQIIYAVTITAPVGSGPYTIVAAPAISTSQDYGVCLTGPSINGPWRV